MTVVPVAKHRELRKHIEGRIKWALWIYGWRLRAALWAGPKADRIASHWLREPDIQTGERVCLFVTVARAGRVLPHALDHMQAWHAAGYKVVAIVVVESLDAPVDVARLAFAEAVLLRINKGYDFGAWAAAITSQRQALCDCTMLALANDSVLGPSSNFAAMVERAAVCDADVIGLVSSGEVRPHLQSFTLFFGQKALQSPFFTRFWASVRSGGRGYVIHKYEIPLASRFEANGLRTAALFTIDPPTGGSPTLSHWRDLLGLGFPYIKLQLIRDNPRSVPLDDWQSVASAAGFDIVRIERQLDALGIGVSGSA